MEPLRSFLEVLGREAARLETVPLAEPPPFVATRGGG